MVRALVQATLLAGVLSASSHPGLLAGEGGQLFQAIDHALAQQDTTVLERALAIPGALPPRDALGRTPLTYLIATVGDDPDAAVCQLELTLVQRLLAAGADGAAAGADGDPPLHLAAACGQPALVTALLAAGASPEALDGKTRTALMAGLAARWPSPEVVAALLAHHATALAPGGHGAHPLASAISCRLTALDDLRQGASAVFGGPPPAQRAASALRIVELLLKAQAPTAVTVPGPSGFAWPALHAVVRAGDLECARLLLDHGAETTGTVDGGFGLMRCAVDSGRPAAVQLIAGLGIGLDEVDEKGSPVAFAAGDAEVLIALLASGTSPDARRADRATLLHYAAEADQATLITALIDHGAHAELTLEALRPRTAKELRDDGGWIIGRTPLWLALAGHRPHALLTLLARGSPTRVRLADGTTALHLAARWSGPLLGAAGEAVPAGQPGDAAALIRLLVAEGAPVDARTAAAAASVSAAVGGRSPLHEACLAGGLDAAATLLELGADGRLKDGQGCEPWRLALAEPGSRAAWIALFAQHGIVVDAREVHRLELLQAVAQGNRVRVGELVAADPALPTLTATGPAARGGLPVLQLALACHDQELVATLLAHGADPCACDARGRASIHLAVESNQPELLTLLIAHGAGIDTLSAGERSAAVTPLALALGRDPGGQVLREAVQSLSLARAVLAAGADVNAGCGSDHCPLEIAAAAGNLAAVQLLLEHGARTDFTDSGGRTLLHLLAWGAANGPDIAELLIARGLDVNQADRQRHEVPLHRLARAGRTTALTLLIAHGAAVDARDVRERTPLIFAAEAGNLAAIEALLAAGAAIDASDLDGVTTLSAAVEAAQVEAVAHLLAHHASSVQTDLAAVRGWTHLRLGQHYKLQALLAAEPAVAAARLIHGQTLLMRAADRGDAQSARLLLEAGADPRAVDERGRSALMHAVQSSGPDRATLVASLLKAGASAGFADPHGQRAADLVPAKAGGDARQERINHVVLSLLSADAGGAPRP